MAIREWLESTAGKIAAAVLILVAVIAIVWAVRGLFGVSSEVAQANTRIFIDAETKKPFTHVLRAGEVFPVRTPSGKEAGYPAEQCFWTKDGQIKSDPTAVLLNDWLGKTEPTFCHDCGRLVRPHNPQPQPGDRPPPLQSEFRGRYDPSDR